MDRLAKARAAKAARASDFPKSPQAPPWATRYNHRLSNKRRLAIRIWQERKRGFFAKVQGDGQVFTGASHEEAMKRLVAHYEGVEFEDVRTAQ